MMQNICRVLMNYNHIKRFNHEKANTILCHVNSFDVIYDVVCDSI